MRYWDDDQPGWNAEEHAFAAAGRKQTLHARVGEGPSAYVSS
jgi:hypothetical protein